MPSIANLLAHFQVETGLSNQLASFSARAVLPTSPRTFVPRKGEKQCVTYVY